MDVTEETIMDWICTEQQKPIRGEWVLVWDSVKGFAIVAKWNGRFWQAVCNNTKAEAGRHWARIVGPDGNKSKQVQSVYEFTKRDSQSA